MKRYILLIFGVACLLFGLFLFYEDYTSILRYDVFNDLVFDDKDEKKEENNKISLNEASVDVLINELYGIGSVKANQIVEYRNKQPFKDTYELVTLKIISETVYDKIKDKITV